MTIDEQLRKAGKEALAKLAANDEPLDALEIRAILRELNAQYREPPFFGQSLGAEITCTEDGWRAHTKADGAGRRNPVGTPTLDPEDALYVLVEQFNKMRAEALRDDEAETR